ncbi:MAG: hypothetical protein ABH846_00980, partial [Patescibacteria group bacterium]
MPEGAMNKPSHELTGQQKSKAFKREMFKPGQKDELPRDETDETIFSDEIPVENASQPDSDSAEARDQDMVKAKKHDAAGELGPASEEKKLEQDYEAEMHAERETEMDAVSAELDRLTADEEAGRPIDRAEELYWTIKAYDLLGEQPPQEMIDEYNDLQEAEQEEPTPDQLDVHGEQRIFKRKMPAEGSEPTVSPKQAERDAEYAANRKKAESRPITAQPSRTPAQIFKINRDVPPGDEVLQAMEPDAEGRFDTTKNTAFPAEDFEAARQQAIQESVANQAKELEDNSEAEEAPDWRKDW